MDPGEEGNVEQGDGGQELSTKELKARFLPPKPERPLTGYNIFIQQYINDRVAEGDDRVMKDIFCEAAIKWNALSEQEKQRYNEICREAWENYKSEMDTWKECRDSFKRPCPPFAAFIRDIWKLEREEEEPRSVVEIARHAACIWNTPEDYKKRFAEEKEMHHVKIREFCQKNRSSITNTTIDSSSNNTNDNRTEEEDKPAEIDGEEDPRQADNSNPGCSIWADDLNCSTSSFLKTNSKPRKLDNCETQRRGRGYFFYKDPAFQNITPIPQNTVFTGLTEPQTTSEVGVTHRQTNNSAWNPLAFLDERNDEEDESKDAAELTDELTKMEPVDLNELDMMDLEE